MPFDPSIDLESKKFWAEPLGTWLCRDRFLIFVKAGEAIDPGQVVSHRFLLPADQHQIEISFYATSEKQIRYIDEEYVKTAQESIKYESYCNFHSAFAQKP